MSAARLAPAFAMLALVACGGEKATPVDPLVPTALAASSSTALTGVAGAVVSPAPSVLVSDQNGAPLAGATVTFAVVSGGGSVDGGTTTTNGSGVATVASWTLGRTTGANILSATAGSLSAVSFTATSVAGPAASLAKNGGDSQTAPVGSAVATAPSVIVKDANSNPKPGVSVTFAVVSGGGSVTGATTLTNISGVASVGSWILGTAAGANTLSATVAGLPSVTFTAAAAAGPPPPPNLCANQSTHTFGTTSGGTLSSDDCQLPDGSFVDFYATSVPEAGAYFFRESAAFDAYLLLALPDGTPVAENDDELDTGTDAGIKALLPAGNYLLGATTFAPGVTGTYTISSTTTSTDVTNCDLVFVVKNITTAQNLTNADCNIAASAGATPINADGYFIFLSAGSTITVDMTSSVLDSFLQIVRLDGVVLAQNDNVDATTKNARITFTAAQSNYYAIFARAVPTTAVGAYNLTIQ